MNQKYALIISSLILQASVLFAQTNIYDDFEGNKSISYGLRTGVLDTAVKNPASNSIDSSATCAMYVRNGTKKFDNIKINIPGKLTNVTAFATYAGIPPQIKIKIYTTAPVGTLVEILLGTKGRNNEYPAGTHSQYQAHTTVSNQWEELKFKFSQIPQGSEAPATEIDQLTILFDPNSLSSDTYYFDDISGPPVGAAKSEVVVPPGKIEK